MVTTRGWAHDRRMAHAEPGSGRPTPTTTSIVAVVVGIPMLYALVVYLIGLSMSPHVADDGCEGIGFGCSLAPRDVAWLYGAGFGVIAVPVSWMVVGIVIWMARRRSSR